MKADERKWYVVRIHAQAARPDLRDERFTKVERELIDAGFDCYMPIEIFDAVHRRKKKLIQKRRQLVPGYVFVTDVTNFWTLAECQSVAGIIGVAGRPVAIPDAEMVAIRAAETAIFESLATERRKLAERERRPTRRSLRKHFPHGARARVKAGILSGREGTVQEATGRKTLRLIIESLHNLGMIELNIDDLELVA